MKGYKRTSDGRVTSFFHTELDDQAKELIGDIAPKRIEKAIEFETVVNFIFIFGCCFTFYSF